MPEHNLPTTYQYQDERAFLTVIPSSGQVTVRASNDGVGASVSLTVVGAQRLASMLGSAITVAITRGGGGR
jgi:hypothetical protein